MIISFYLFLTWLTIGLLFTGSNKLPRQQLVFVFVFATFMNTNIGYLLADPFAFYTMPKDPARYVAFSLYLSLLFPALVAIMVNAYSVSSLRRTIVVLISIGIFLSLDLLARILDVFTYAGHWHLPVLLGYRLLLLFLSIFALKGFKRM